MGINSVSFLDMPLRPTSTCVIFVESGKQMAQKIQRTEQRRAHRAQRHLSAPEAVTTPGRRMSLRYSFQSKPRFGNKEEFVQKLQGDFNR